jgi:hypothetical protein
MPAPLLCQALPFNIFHRNEVASAGLANVIDVRRIGVTEGGSGPSLPDEAVQAVLVLSQLRRQNLHRHGPPEPCVFSPIHFSHPADTQQTADFVDSKLFPYQTSIGPFCHFGHHLLRRASMKDVASHFAGPQTFQLYSPQVRPEGADLNTAA